MPAPHNLWELVHQKVEQLGISEREAGRRTGMDTRKWSYYLKEERDDVTPHKILLRLSRLGIPILALEKAALLDDGWRIATIRDTDDQWEMGIEPPPAGDDSDGDSG